MPHKVTLYEWIEAALDIAKPCCQIHTKTRLELRFIIDENDQLIDWYICCPNKNCYREYSFLMTFHPLIIEEGR